MVEQAAAIPFQTLPCLKVLMVTSRSSGQWIFPKGCIDPGFTAPSAALQEALEEAGVQGTLEDHLGSYLYQKWGQVLRVQLYTLKVETILPQWLEQNQRQRRWFEPRQALLQVRHPEARRLFDQWLTASIEPESSPPPESTTDPTDHKD